MDETVQGGEPADKVNILLVDDEPGNLLALEAILEELGENLVRANSEWSGEARLTLTRRNLRP